jgi:hypothetical protein
MDSPRATLSRRLLAAMAGLTLGLIAGACQAQRLHYGDPDVYHGPYLSWAGKRVPAKAAAPASQGQLRRFKPQPAAAAWNQDEGGAPPANGYARPPVQTPDQQRAAAVAAPTPAPTNQTGGSGSRFYSLHREFGLTPDPIPKTSGHMVLIGPPAHAPNLAADEDSAVAKKGGKHNDDVGDDDDDGSD